MAGLAGYLLSAWPCCYQKLTTIGQGIPPYQVTTVELAMNPLQRKVYETIHVNLSHKLGGARQDEVTGEGRMNQGINRLLCHAVLNPELHKIVKCSKASNVQEINRWYDRDHDYGVSWYHQQT